jgi:hypothetical protein
MPAAAHSQNSSISQNRDDIQELWLNIFRTTGILRMSRIQAAQALGRFKVVDL